MMKTLSFALVHVTVAFSVVYAMTGSMLAAVLSALVVASLQYRGLSLSRKDPVLASGSGNSKPVDFPAHG
jgi:hypothetical protein